MSHDANSVVPKLMEAKGVSWPIGYAAMKDAEKLLTPKGLKRGFKSLGRIVSEETLIAKALELLEAPERQQTVIDATDRIKKATKKPIKLCRAAMKAADYDEARALKILKGEAEDPSGDMPVEEIKPAKEFTRLLGLCRQNDRDLAVVGVRRKKLTKREIAIRKEEARNEVYLGEIDDCTLCWRYDGTWHRVEAPRWRYVNLWFDDGRLIYAANEERAASKIVTLTAPGEATRTELPMTISGFRVGDTGMLATGANSKAPVWVCDRGGEWRDIGIPDGLAATGRYALAGSADHGYWVSWGPDLYRWHDGEWHAVTTRGTVYPKGWQGITTDGERVAAMHDGELCVGDVNLLKPVRLSKAPFAAWFEGKQLVVADTQQEIDFLLEHGAVCKKWKGVTRAIDYDQMALLKRSLAAGIEADVTVVLTYALKRPAISAEAVRLLLTAKPALDNGDTGALFYAIAAKRLDVAQLLVEAGADLAKQHFDPANLRADPLTAVQHADRLGNVEVAEYLHTVRSP